MYYPTLWRGRAGVPNVSGALTGGRNEFDRIVDRWFGIWTGGSESAAVRLPVVDVRETSDEVLVQAELPGLTKDDVEVQVEHGVLTISGEKTQGVEQGKEGADYHLVERSYGRFQRSFTLPRSVDADKVAASFENGVLNVSLPKVAAAKPRQIEIK